MLIIFSAIYSTEFEVGNVSRILTNFVDII